jgi:hypothetical protein
VRIKDVFSSAITAVAGYAYEYLGAIRFDLNSREPPGLKAEAGISPSMRKLAQAVFPLAQADDEENW